MFDKLIILIIITGVFALYRRSTGWHVVYLMAFVTGGVLVFGVLRLLPGEARELMYEWLLDAPGLLPGMIAYSFTYMAIPIIAIYLFGRIDESSPRIYTGLGLWLGLGYAVLSVLVGKPPAEVTHTWMTWLNWATVPLFYVVSMGIVGLALYFRLRTAVLLILVVLVIDSIVSEGMYFSTSNRHLSTHASFRLFVSVAAAVYLPMLVRYLQERHDRRRVVKLSDRGATGESVA